jgi:phenylacetic acid degradation operon negative regulatory protein
MPPRPTVRTQFLIFHLFGDYVLPRDRRAWTSGLIDLLRVLGVSERAARSTLSRMKRKGWLESTKDGRRSAYNLTPRGRALLEEGSRRLFDPRPKGWDGHWHVVIYSLPQEQRSLRRELRTRLSWLGYGMLLPGIMVSATARSAQVCALLRELGAEPYVYFFTGSHLEQLGDREIVARCWDLEEINRRYGQFIQRHQGDLEAMRRSHRRGDGLQAESGFVYRFWVTYEYSSFPRLDPNLPDELIPTGWLGDEAAELLAEYRALTRAPAEDFIESTLGFRPPQPELEEVGAPAEATFVSWP